MEFLTKENLSKRLRMPAQSRMQKIHNVVQALDILKGQKQLESSTTTNGSAVTGSNAAAVSRYIVDGNLEQTLKLIWDIITT